MTYRPPPHPEPSRAEVYAALGDLTPDERAAYEERLGIMLDVGPRSRRLQQRPLAEVEADALASVRNDKTLREIDMGHAQGLDVRR